MDYSTDRDHNSGSDADASYYCTDYGQEFKSLQELIEHKSLHYK
jgi:hypothetical protein